MIVVAVASCSSSITTPLGIAVGRPARRPAGDAVRARPAPTRGPAAGRPRARVRGHARRRDDVPADRPRRPAGPARRPARQGRLDQLLGHRGARRASPRRRSSATSPSATRDRGLVVVGISVQETTPADVAGLRRALPARLHDRRRLLGRHLPALPPATACRPSSSSDPTGAIRSMSSPAPLTEARAIAQVEAILPRGRAPRRAPAGPASSPARRQSRTVRHGRAVERTPRVRRPGDARPTRPADLEDRADALHPADLPGARPHRGVGGATPAENGSRGRPDASPGSASTARPDGSWAARSSAGRAAPQGRPAGRASRQGRAVPRDAKELLGGSSSIERARRGDRPRGRVRLAGPRVRTGDAVEVRPGGQIRTAAVKRCRLRSRSASRRARHPGSGSLSGGPLPDQQPRPDAAPNAGRQTHGLHSSKRVPVADHAADRVLGLVREHDDPPSSAACAKSSALRCDRVEREVVERRDPARVRGPRPHEEVTEERERERALSRRRGRRSPGARPSGRRSARPMTPGSSSCSPSAQPCAPQSARA